MSEVRDEVGQADHETQSPRQRAETALCEALLADGRLSEGQLERAVRLQREQLAGEPIWLVLSRLGVLPEREIMARLAEQSGLSLALGADLPDRPPVPARLSRRFLVERRALVMDEAPGVLLVALTDPFDSYLVHALRFACGVAPELRLALPSELEAALERLGREAEAEEEGAAGEGAYEADAERLREAASEAPVVRLVSQTLQRAVEARASDIHVEPFEDTVRIRYRIDGVLREVDSRPVDMASAVVSRIKIMANLNIAERRLPQDGRFRVRALARDIDLRVSTVPTLYGESVVIRLLHRADVALDFDDLGFEGDLGASLLDVLNHPHGIVLVTGPTGSGKTTTLYAALRHLNTQERKILTVEDPVEYHLTGINQIQVKPQIGLNFAAALRSIVRQDPDVIMIGEMRDRETAEIAVQSALTGHLVLSTLHTNDAAGSITRLMDMGVEDYLITSTVRGVLAQRLVRRLCPDCRQPTEIPLALAHRLNLAGDGFDAPAVYHSTGCEACDGSGFRGRTCIAEFMLLTDSLRQMILERADAARLGNAARHAGMRTLFQDGLEKALAGVTSLDEVLRVTRDS